MKFVEKMPNALRWILALPIAIFCSYSLRYITIISAQLLLHQRFTGSEILFLSIDNILGVVALISIIYLVVPKYKLGTSVIVSTIFAIILFFTYGTIFIGYKNNPSILEMPLWKYIYSFVAAIISVIYSCFMIYKNEKYGEV